MICPPTAPKKTNPNLRQIISFPCFRLPVTVPSQLTWTLIAPLDGSTAMWNASTAFASGNLWVTSDLRSIRPDETSRIALGYWLAEMTKRARRGTE